jgi:DNA mismatch endonuclease (patch repair protein)
MTDHVSAEKRSDMMRQVRRTGSSAELAVRKIVWALGYRYRLNVRSLPGSPDLAFTRRRKAIFVHGCFWHGHLSCRKARLPKTNSDYWKQKVLGNTARDSRVQAELASAGWEVLVVWQCEIKDLRSLQDKLKTFLERP